MQVSRNSTLASMAFLLAGCTMAPDYHRPASPVAAHWRDATGNAQSRDATRNAQSRDAAGNTSDQAADGRNQPDNLASLNDWKQFYRDPLLQNLIEAALTNNRDLQIAQHQIEAASAQFDIENAQLLPSLSGGAGANIQKENARIYSLSQGSASAFYLRQYAVGFGISAYEIDLWGRIRSASHAAFDRYMANALSRESMRLSLIASVSTATLNWVANNQAALVTAQVLQSRRHTYDLVKQTADIGRGTQLAVAEAEVAVHDAETSAQIYARQRAQALDQLELLVGMPLDTATLSALSAKTSLETITAFPNVPAGLPSDMIARRPDILSAEQNVRASNDDIGAARAEFFPKIQITAANGTASNNITRLFESGMGAWNVAPQITLPIFDAGRLTAQLHQAKAHKKEEIASYEKTVQTAFREVADALAGRSTYLTQLEAQKALVEASTRQYNLAMLRFKAGYDPYLDTLVAQRSFYDAKLGSITTQLQEMTNSITLYKTLGGGWSETTPQRQDPLVNHIL